MSDTKHWPTRFEPAPMAAPLILVDAASNFQKGKLFIKTSPDLRLVCTMGSEGTWMTRRATAKAIVSRYNSHDALVTALAQMVAVFDHPKLSTPADRAMARIAGHAALKASKGEA